MKNRSLKKIQDYLLTFLVLSLSLSLLQILNVDQVTKTHASGSCTISYFSPLPQTVYNGGSSTLTWVTNGCATAYILAPGDLSITGQPVSTDGSYSTGPLSSGQTYSYTLNAFDALGNKTSQTVQVYTVQQAAYCSILSFSSSPQSIQAGNSSSLSWNTANCNSVSIDNGVGVVGASGSSAVSPSQNTTYTLTASGLVSGPNGPVGGTITSKTIVYVNQPTSGCTIGTFMPNQNPVAYGGSSNLAWSVSGTACSVSLQGTDSNSLVLYSNQGEPLDGSYNVTNITQTEYWTLTATDTSTGAQQVMQITLTVNNSCSIQTFSATNVTSGSPSTLTWTMQGCTRAQLSGGEFSNNSNGYTSVVTSGSVQTSPLTQTTTYSLTGFNNNNMSLIMQATATVSGQNCTVTVTRSLNSATGSITSGGSYQVWGISTNISGSSDTSYVATVPSTGAQISVSSVTGGTGTVNGQSWNIIPSTGDSKTCASSNNFIINLVPTYKTAAKLNVQ